MTIFLIGQFCPNFVTASHWISVHSSLARALSRCSVRSGEPNIRRLGWRRREIHAIVARTTLSPPRNRWRHSKRYLDGGTVN
jgi:hypothetical protein